MPEPSKSQINKLGDRLRSGPPTDDDLRMLDEFRRSFSDPFDLLTQDLQKHALPIFKRQAKSTPSIVAKLKREHTELSRIQDIAGCRIIVADIKEQDRLTRLITDDYPKAKVRDRRVSPSHGYRAVHIVVQGSGKPIEIQIRTKLQQLWAELSEKAFDVIDPAIKYGGGPERWKKYLEDASSFIKTYEDQELAHADAPSPQILNHLEGDKKSLQQFLNDLLSLLDNPKDTKQ